MADEFTQIKHKVIYKNLKRRMRFQRYLKIGLVLVVFLLFMYMLCSSNESNKENHFPMTD
jgi:hypothetical protein